MPYRRAEVYILLQLCLTIIAFWPSYFNRIKQSPFGFHLHGVTATAWMILLAAQIWTAHDSKRKLHRILGQASMILFPVLLAGMSAVIISLASKAVAGNRFYVVYGERLEAVSIFAFTAFALFYFFALRTRQRVQLHARYMIATTLMLCFTITDRLDGYLPLTFLHGLVGFTWCVRVANGLSLVLALVLFLANRQYGKPYILAGLIMIFQMISWETVDRAPSQLGLIHLAATLPLAPTLSMTAVIGVAICMLGWRTGMTNPPLNAALAKSVPGEPSGG